MGASLSHGRDGAGELFIIPGGHVPENAAEIDALAREETGEQASFGGQPGTVAVTEKGLGHAADDPYLAQRSLMLTVGSCGTPALRGFAGGAALEADQRHVLGEPPNEFGAGDRKSTRLN